MTRTGILLPGVALVLLVVVGVGISTVKPDRRALEPVEVAGASPETGWAGYAEVNVPTDKDGPCGRLEATLPWRSGNQIQFRTAFTPCAVSPTSTNIVVKLERRRQLGWQQIRRADRAHAGEWTWRYDCPGTGRYSYRVVVMADPARGHKTTQSRELSC